MAKSCPAFGEAVANMAMSTSPFYNDYVFYMHLLSQCRVVFDEKLPAPAGVSFNTAYYTLWINPSEVVAEGKDKEGNHVVIPGFTDKMPLSHRIGIIKHEMLHIAFGHLIRVGDKDFKGYNYASDCALNQQIKRDHLPDGAIYPDTLPVKEGTKVLENESAEYYYDLFENPDKPPEDGEGEGNVDGNSEGGGENNGKSDPTGGHGKWKESEGDPDLQQEITKNMVERSANQTQQGRGNLPSNYSTMIDNLIIKREVDWKKVLRSIVGNKKANIRKTLLRRDRRQPNASWIKGKTKDRIFSLGAISDVSGSVSDVPLMKLWSEVISLCKTFDTDVYMVQVDTQPTEPEKLTKSTRKLERKRCGGTILYPAIEQFKKSGIHYDALLVTTDGYLGSEDVDYFARLKVPVVWLIEPDGQIMSEMNYGRMRAIKLKKD
jgi:predicted metal-dependent peptidase